MNPSAILGSNKSRIQVLEFDKASGAVAAGTSITDTIEFDSMYTQVLGVALFEKSDSDLGDNYDVQILDGQKREIIQQISKTALESTKGVPQHEKFFPLKFDIRSGEKVQVSLVPGAAGATDNLKVQIAFLLVNSKSED